MIRIDIVDDNLRERTGHYFDFCFQMAREFKQAGFDIRVWGANFKLIFLLRPHLKKKLINLRDFLPLEIFRAVFSLFGYFC